MDEGGKKKVLVSGPYNVFLSTCHPLLTFRPDVEVHITPGATAADLVAKTSDGALKSCVTGSWQPIRFHALDAPMLADVWTKLPRGVRRVRRVRENFAQSVSWRNLRAEPRRIMDTATSWRGEHYACGSATR